MELLKVNFYYDLTLKLCGFDFFGIFSLNSLWEKFQIYHFEQTREKTGAILLTPSYQVINESFILFPSFVYAPQSLNSP